jgi:hypothetical protein
VAGVAPGMTQVIVAGESYILKDDNGKELELKGADDPKTIEFLHAFDAWQAITTTLGHSSDAAVSQYEEVLTKWRALPERLVTGMPSYRAGGIMVPGRPGVALDHDH